MNTLSGDCARFVMTTGRKESPIMTREEDRMRLSRLREQIESLKGEFEIEISQLRDEFNDEIRRVENELSRAGDAVDSAPDVSSSDSTPQPDGASSLGFSPVYRKPSGGGKLAGAPRTRHRAGCDHGSRCACLQWHGA